MDNLVVWTRRVGIPVLFFFSMGAGSVLAQDFEVDERVALPFPPGIALQSQCGQVDDLQHVEFYDGTLGVDRPYVDTHEPTTVQMQWLDEAEIRSRLPDHSPGNVAGNRWCTGTLLDNHRVLTAGHCFDVADGGGGYWVTPYKLGTDGSPQFASPDELATLQVVNFGYQINGATGEIRDAKVYPIVALVEYREGGDHLDYAVIELGPGADGKLPGDVYEPADVSTRAATIGENLAIIQHPHGDPKKVEAGKVLGTSGAILYYDDIDTHGGSSGSGVRDREGTVIGVHTNGGCQHSANRGVSLNSVADVSDIF